MVIAHYALYMVMNAATSAATMLVHPCPYVVVAVFAAVLLLPELELDTSGAEVVPVLELESVSLPVPVPVPVLLPLTLMEVEDSVTSELAQVAEPTVVAPTQTVQDDAAVRFWNVPTGHEVQVIEPFCAAKRPAGQAAQLLELAMVAKKPTAQT